MLAALLEPGDPRWIDVLERIPHDMYHLPGYATFATRWHESGEAMAFVASERDSDFLVPLIVRAVPPRIADRSGSFDATGPRGYPGPIVRSGPDGPDLPFLESAIEALVGELHQRQIVTAFVRCHPLLSPPLDVLRTFGDVVDHGESVSIDLARSAEQAWADTRENHRRAVNRARRSGYAVRIDTAWTRLDEFLAIHAAAMDRLGAAPSQRIVRGQILDLRSSTGSALHLALVEHAGDLAAAALLSEVDGIVEYHLAATAPDHVAASPTKLLIAEITGWARDRGDRVFHLAGSLRHDDPLIHFKRGFSPLVHRVASWRLVADPDAYARLVDRWERLSGRPAEAADGDAPFFPAYRREIGRVNGEDGTP